MNAQLDFLDRSTLVVWRVTNLIGWAALGTLIAIQIHWLLVQTMSFSSTSGFYRGGAFEPELGITSTLRMLGIRAMISVFAAYSIGFLVGRRTSRWQIGIAALGALAYVLTALIGLEHSLAGAALVFGLGDQELHWAVQNPLWRVLLHDGVITLTIPLAVLVASRTVRERSVSPEQPSL